jgi:hypothetical protein
MRGNFIFIFEKHNYSTHLGYLGFFARWRLRKRTRGPPPFSSMNSMPARNPFLK